MVEFMAKIDDSVKNVYQLQEQKEDLIDRLDRILEWIKTCDTKTSILLAGMGIVGTLLTSEKLLQKETDVWEVFSRNIGWLKIICGADVKIMDRLFWHREVPHSENFSKPGFQLKTA